MRDFIGKEIARYEHGARRLQMFFWAVIAINTFIGIVWGALSLDVVLMFYVVGVIGVLLFGYVSHKVRVGESITMAQFDIESKELWISQVSLNAALFAMYSKMPKEELTNVIRRLCAKLKIDESIILGIDWSDE